MMRYFIIGTFLFFIGSCLNPPDYSPIPSITFDSISSTTARVNHDSITFFIGFKDGDGDLGSSDIPDLFFTSSLTGYPDSFKIPNLTPAGNVKAISGVIAYTFGSFNCIPGTAFDTLDFTIYIEDRSGNKSNTVVSPQIILECQ